MNFSINEFIKPEGFDPLNDKIAIVINEFELKKNPDWPQKYSEPYIVSLAIDQQGAKNPTIDFNILPFPKIGKGDVTNFGGQGHLVYGPANPGEFVAYSILYMESDSDVRKLGKTIEDIVKSEAVASGLSAILIANPTFAVASKILTGLSVLIARQMAENDDDELFRQNGTLLRDVEPPYDNNKPFESNNDFIRSKINVVPLTKRLDVEKNTEKILL